jgi:ATP/maltotriose-dependent transcriptional regulator MalT
VPLLEREVPLARLTGLLSEARHRRGHVALVTGEAGVGKTSLLEAFRQQAGRTQVLWGACDAIEPPRAFAPVRDIADRAGGTLRSALATADRDRVINEFLSLLRRSDGLPRLVVLEDLHWADDATLDLLRVVGRRIRDQPVLLVGSYRDDEVGVRHPLRKALGDLPPDALVETTLQPLSIDAVAILAAGTGLQASRLHRLTAGNPFFVTEVIAAPGDVVPRTVRDAVLARLGRLPYQAQLVARAAAVLGDRCAPWLLSEVHGQDARSLELCIEQGVLVRLDEVIRFRHELVRQAMIAALTQPERAEIHARALAVLRRTGEHDGVDELAHHAAGAGDGPAVLQYAPAAAARSARLGAHREAAAYYAAALPYRWKLDQRSRAGLLEAHAAEHVLADDVTSARATQEEALACWRSLGDRRREGDCLRAYSEILYLGGEGERAEECARDALTILESIEPQGHELALAIATLAQRVIVSGHDDPMGVTLARRAVELAERIGDEPVAVSALTTLGVGAIYMSDADGWAIVEQSARRARAAGLVHEGSRALINLVEAASDVRQLGRAERYLEEAIAFMDEHDIVLHQRILRQRRAEVALERGRWEVALDEAQTLLELPGLANRTRVRAITLRGRIAARRGDVDPWPLLDEGLALTSPHELQELCPLLAARAEAAWLDGDVAKARAEAGRGLPLARKASMTPEPWFWAELAWWAWKTGALDHLPDNIPMPYRQQAAGLFRAASTTWDELGCPYQQALALGESDEEVALREAIGILHRLGAWRSARRVADRLRGTGASDVPRGAWRSTRRNPSGLTAREVEVLGLLGLGLRNAQIAERLVVSPKTIDHHVSAILRKLGVGDRGEAALAAARMGLKDGERDSQT